jgi:hypothetical protein
LEIGPAFGGEEGGVVGVGAAVEAVVGHGARGVRGGRRQGDTETRRHGDKERG